MTFVTAGLAVAGLIAIAIPIVIFLLWRQRRSPVEWGAMRFLIEAYRKHRRRLQVEQLLLLLVRCLVLALLGLALARPLLEGTGLLDTGGSRLVYLLVDDGLVSGAVSAPDSTALASHVARARQIIDRLDAGDRVGLVTTARPARAVLSPPSSDLASAVELLESLEPASAPTDLPGALDRLAAVLDGLDADHDQVFVYLLSDFRAGSAVLEDALPASLDDLGERVVLLASPPAAEPLPNVQITSIEPARSLILADSVDGSDQVTVRLARMGGDLREDVSRVRLAGEGISRLEPVVVEWSTGETEATAEFMLDVSDQRARETGITAIIEDDALAGDNQRHTVIALRKRIRIVLVDRRSFGFEPALDRLGAGQWIRRALAPTDESPMETIVVEPAALEVADLRTADVAIVPRPDLLAEDGWSLLRSFVDKGGLVLLMPPGDLTVHRWADQLFGAMGLPWRLEREVVEEPAGRLLALEQPPSALLQMISGDLPELCRPVLTTRTLPVDRAATQADAVLLFEDGSPLMIAGSPGVDPGVADPAEGGTAPGGVSRGIVAYLATSPELEWSNLPSKPLMVPLVHETIRQGLSLIRASGPVAVGTRPPLGVGPAAAALVGPDEERVDLDSFNRPDRPFTDAGLYRVTDRAGVDLGVVAVNVDAEAARTDPQPASAVESWLGESGPWETLDLEDPGAALARAEEGSPLAGILLAVVVALLVLEAVIARWFSHASEAGPGEDTLSLRPTMYGMGGRA